MSHRSKRYIFTNVSQIIGPSGSYADVRLSFEFDAYTGSVNSITQDTVQFSLPAQQMCSNSPGIMYFDPASETNFNITVKKSIVW